jgi:hypothetical protein
MNKFIFSKIAESLRLYRRAVLDDFKQEIGESPVDQVYVDPLPGDAVLTSVLSNNTTFLLGRKGTGKSTVFVKAQSELRKRKESISIYIDVKSLYDLIENGNVPTVEPELQHISISTYRSHILRKAMLGQITAKLLSEIRDTYDRLGWWDKWISSNNKLSGLKRRIEELESKVKTAKLEHNEIPVLQKITHQLRVKSQEESQRKSDAKSKLSGKSGVTGISGAAEYSESSHDFEKVLDDNDTYNEYSDIIFKSFPFADIIEEIQTALKESGLSKLVVFFDDFSELSLLNQRLFVDVVLSPLNNSSNELIKLKIAGYPGRVYYGKIDPSKVDTVSLDFSDLYEANEVQEMERAATDYTDRLLRARFKAFNVKFEDYFDVNSVSTISSYMKLMFTASFNVPRIMGHILYYCYMDRISKGQKVNSAAIKLASRKYFDNTISTYFNKMNRFALEPFDNKLDRHNQQQLLNFLIDEIKTTKSKIVANDIGGNYFSELRSNPYVSHFFVTPELDDIFSSLESNFFLSRYKTMRDKDRKQVTVYALFMGACEIEKLNWGYPEGREYRQYFQQRCFDYSRAILHYISSKQTIKCNSCSTCFPLNKKDSFEMYKWGCPECTEGTCAVVNLSDDFKDEVNKLNKEVMLDPVDLEILSILQSENRKMSSGEIAALIGSNHQLVGKRTTKLEDMRLVNKLNDLEDRKRKSQITQRALDTYFSNSNT